MRKNIFEQKTQVDITIHINSKFRMSANSIFCKQTSVSFEDWPQHATWMISFSIHFGPKFCFDLFSFLSIVLAPRFLLQQKQKLFQKYGVTHHEHARVIYFPVVKTSKIWNKKKSVSHFELWLGIVISLQL